MSLASVIQSIANVGYAPAERPEVLRVKTVIEAK